MIAKRPSLAWTLIAALALAGLPAGAWAQRQGGGHRGSGRSAGHAVSRSGSPGRVPGGIAGTRHPRAGTGTGGHHGRYYGGHYGRGYYGHGYYRPYGYASFYLGWPYYGSVWWPQGWGSSYDPGDYAPPYGYGYDSRMAAPPADEGRRYDESERPEGPDAAYPPPRNTGRVRLEVRPDDASIYVDDEFWGNAHETKLLTLRSGRHAIDLVRPGFSTARREVDVVPGESSDVLVELERP